MLEWLSSVSDIWLRKLRRPMVSTVYQEENVDMIQEAVCHYPGMCSSLALGITPTFMPIKSGP